MAKYNTYDELDEKPAKSTKRQRRASFIGFLGVVVGLVAVGLTQRDRINDFMDAKGIPFSGYMYQVDRYQVNPNQVAAAAAGLAVISLLLRSMTGRTRRGWPVLALLLSASAVGIWRYDNSTKEPGTVERWVQDNIVYRLDAMIHPHDAPAPTVQVKTPVPSVDTPPLPEGGLAKPATRPAAEPPVKPSKLFPET